MAKTGGMTLRDALQMQANLQAKVASITDLVGSSNPALLSLCRTPEFLAYYRESFGVDKAVPDATVLSDIENSINPVEQVSQDKPVESPFPKKDTSTTVLNRGFCSGTKQISPRRKERNVYKGEQMMTLECGVVGLTTRGMVKGGKSWLQYDLVPVSEFIKLWKDYVAVPSKKCRSWLGIYAIRVTRADGAFKDYAVSKFGKGFPIFRDECVQSFAGQAPMIDVYYYRMEFILMRLIQVLYDEFGDDCIQNLGQRVADAWLNTNQASPLKELFITEEILRSRGEKSDNALKFVKLPGQFVLNGVTDRLFIYQSNLDNLKRSEDRDIVFRGFRNGGYFSILFMSLAEALMPDKSSEDVEKWCDRTVQFLLLPE